MNHLTISPSSSASTAVSDSTALCVVCQEMDLRPERFRIDRNATEKRSSFNAELFNRLTNNFSLRSGAAKIILGSRRDIRMRGQNCPFCSLVSRSIRDGYDSTNPSDQDPFDDAVCEGSWEIDGRESIHENYSHTNNRTRRMKLSWKMLSNGESPLSMSLEKYTTYLVLVAPERRPGEPNSDARSLSQRQPHYLGRTIDAEKGKQSLIESWLNICKKYHGEPCNNTSLNSDGAFLEVLSSSYFGVIDVQEWCLKSLPYREDGQNGRFVHERYAALSYVWGASEPHTRHYVTTRSNVIEHQAHGGLEKIRSKLSRAINDSIDLVQKIGIRYIWIDALCIVQDSPGSWNLNANVMNHIYSNALVTICAADGEDSSSGLIAMQSGHQSDQIQAQITNGLKLMVSQPPEIGVRSSTWNQRAWTFQERLLSRRCLIFTGGRMHFQCRSSGMSEDVYADGKGTGWSLDSIQAPLQMLRELRSRSFWFYTNCVGLYTSRNLTKQGDILAAFSGISHLLKEKMNAPLIFGLPNSHFDLALLWEPMKAISRRDLGEQDRRNREFPSWSWCGWKDSTMLYNSDMVQSCLEDVREWLEFHTWICWYIRDADGYLRSLCDPDESKEDHSTELRWRGYPRFNSKAEEGKKDQFSWSSVRGETPTVEEEIEQHSYREHGRKLVREVSTLSVGESEASTRSDHSDVPVAYTVLAANRAHGNGNQQAELYRERDIIESGRILSKEQDQEPRDRDNFARPIRRDVEAYRETAHEFRETLPDYPFRVLKTCDRDGFRRKPILEQLDQPVLQFWTWKTSLHMIPSSGSLNDMEGRCRCDIADTKGDWCGSMIVNKEWIQARGEYHTLCEFIALSDAKCFVKEECPSWTYYIPKEQHESSWDLFFVMLVEFNYTKGFYERVGLGKVFSAAFSKDRDEWKEILLG